MYQELETIKDEKTYWLDRLTRTTKEVLGKKTKKGRRIDPINKTKFKRANKDYTTNKSLLLDSGMLTLNNHAMMRTHQSSKIRSMSAAGDCWDKPDSGTVSFNKRNNKLRTKTIYGSGGYEMNLSATIGNSIHHIYNQRESSTKSIQKKANGKSVIEKFISRQRNFKTNLGKSDLSWDSQKSSKTL